MKNLQIKLFFGSLAIASLLISMLGKDKAEAAAYVRASRTISEPTMLKETFEDLYQIGKEMVGPFNYVIISQDTLGLIRHNDTVLIWKEDGFYELSNEYYAVDSVDHYGSETLPKKILASYQQDGKKEEEKQEQKVGYVHIGEAKTEEEKERVEKQVKYAKRFARVAQIEQIKYGIPAEIKLAQGILESAWGTSLLARNVNNHFGIKCRKGGCSKPYYDRMEKSFSGYRTYKSAWQSYRDHSLFLQGKRYKHLQNLKETDYRGWAHGLKKAGYATDKNYAYKLIGLIEDLQLYKYNAFYKSNKKR